VRCPRALPAGDSLGVPLAGTAVERPAFGSECGSWQGTEGKSEAPRIGGPHSVQSSTPREIGDRLAYAYKLAGRKSEAFQNEERPPANRGPLWEETGETPR
jgi:hypothetical protein